ncbi:MAG: AAA family ATPase [Pseudonocardia sp.]
MTTPMITLVARLAASAADARRGVVRLHPEVLDALGLEAWDAASLTGTRVTTALAAPAPAGAPPGQATFDDVTLSNAGLTDGAGVVVAPARVQPARQVLLAGSRLARAALAPETVRLALLGKVIMVGDAVSLLPQDLEPAAGLDVPAARARLSGAVGSAWTSELLTVAVAEPEGAVAVVPSTVVGWQGGPVTGSTALAPASRGAGWGDGGGTGGRSGSAVPGLRGRSAGENGGPGTGRAGGGGGAGRAGDSAIGGGGPGQVAGDLRAGEGGPGQAGRGPWVGGGGPGQAGGHGIGEGGPGRAEGGPGSGQAAGPVDGPQTGPAPALAIDELVGNVEQARRLVEWLDLTLRRPELLVRLGGEARLGVLLVGPEGAGKATLVRSAAAAVEAAVVELAAPAAAALEPGAASARVHEATAAARAAAQRGVRAVLLVTDVEALLPSAAPTPLGTLALDALRAAVATSGVALVATSAAPESVDARLRAPELADRELSVGLPDARTRAELLRRLLATVPIAEGVDLAAIADRTPGFVVADLAAVRREAAVRAALRHAGGTDGARITQQDLLDAVASVRPISMSTEATLNTGGITLDQVGDMAEVKQALTEAVLWPLQYPDSFARLGVAAPRGVLVYGPPGCGKTFLLRALAGTGRLNVLAVKGAELLDKYVGESERAVRELFRRAADAAPALVFLDEVDALAPRRGQSSDAGVTDRVVAALLTELDGAEPLRDVVVVGATNRPDLIDPALLRPGRLERLIYVPPPDAAARADILRAAGRNTPLAPDVDLDALGAELEGYSAADCAAVLREAALTAMRADRDAAEVTAAHLAAAREVVPPSLDPVQLMTLEAYAARRAPD